MTAQETAAYLGLHVNTVKRLGDRNLLPYYRVCTRSALPPSAYTEREWQHQVEQVLDLYAWDYRYHVVRSRMSPWGWPDLVAIRRRDHRILFAELKTASGLPTPDQVGLLELLLDVSGGGYIGGPGDLRLRHRDGWDAPAGLARVDVELWRPGDIDRVMEVLR